MRTTLKARLWLNAVLVVIAVILAAILYFKPGEKKPPAPTRLTTLTAADIHNIKIAQRGAATVELALENGAWQMTSPTNMPADQFEVTSLLNSIAPAVNSSFTAPSTGLAQYGLAPPLIQLWLNGTEFDFGGTEPLDNLRYVLSGGQVHLINGLLFYRINHRPYWWASKKLLPEKASITAIQLPNATLTSQGDQWQLAPANPEVSADAIQTLVQNWRDAQAMGVEKIGAGKPDGEIAIQITGEKSAIRFAIFKDPNFLVLARPDLGIEYELAASAHDELLSFKSPSKPSAATTGTSKPAATHSPPPHAQSKIHVSKSSTNPQKSPAPYPLATAAGQGPQTWNSHA